MSRPKDIPQDVWEQAEEVWESLTSIMPMDRDAETATIARAILSAKAEQREIDASKCEAQAKVFLSPEYATGQPLASVQERFACEQCASAIRAGV